jgi:hypothetical protein
LPLTCLLKAALVALAMSIGAAAPAAAQDSLNANRRAIDAWERQLLAKGFLRTDLAPRDAPYTNAELARNFREIVFKIEFYYQGDKRVARRLDSSLSKWVAPIRYRIDGDAVTAEDVRTIRAFAGRLQVLTGVSFTETTAANANFIISIESEAGRRRLSQSYRDGVDRQLGRRLEDWSEDISWPCGGTAWERGGVIDFAHVYIKAEAQGLMRESCIHEEIAQALGPGNDYPLARPSIFNDDEEFALLTEHDEMILRVLYDARLRPGDRAETSLTTVRNVIVDLRPSGGPITRLDEEEAFAEQDVQRPPVELRRRRFGRPAEPQSLDKPPG